MIKKLGIHAQAPCNNLRDIKVSKNHSNNENNIYICHKTFISLNVPECNEQ